MSPLAAPRIATPSVVAAGPPGGTSTPLPVADPKFRAKVKDAAQAFEGQFLSMMFAQMFQGVPTDGPFGGGFGEEMFRSMMTDAMAKNVTKAGGIGLADTVQREMLKMQGLS